MPRRASEIPADSMQMRFREQVIALMAREGMNDASLAKRASQHYPVSPGTIWKIRNSDPPRRIDIDEAAAIAKAFGLASIEDMLTPEWAKERLVLLERIGQSAERLVEEAHQIRLDAGVPPLNQSGQSDLPADRRDLLISRMAMTNAANRGDDHLKDFIRFDAEKLWRIFAYRLSQDPDSRIRYLRGLARQRDGLVEVAEEVQTRLRSAIADLEYQMAKVSGENGNAARMWRSMVKEFPALAEIDTEVGSDVQ